MIFSPRHLTVVLLLTAGCGANAEDGKSKLPPATGEGAAPMPALPRVETAAPASSLSPTVGRTTGTTYPRQESQLGPNASGVILEIPHKEGARVEKGTVLVRLDPRDASLRVLQAKAALSAAQVNLRATETEYQRGKQLMEKEAMNRAQWERLEASYEGAKVGVEQAQVAVQMAEKALSDTTVRAPFAGVVAMKLKSVGEMATMMPPTVVLVLQDQSVLELRFRVSEHAHKTVKIGDKLTARFGALDVEREATVVRIMPTVDPRTRTVELIAELENADGQLRPGLLADVRLGAASVTATGALGGGAK